MDGNLAMANQMEYHQDNPELVKKEITKALQEQRFYNPYDVFTHAPEYYDSDIEGYNYKIEIVHWNTKSTRMTVLYSRWNDKKQKYVFRRASGLKRTCHGEKMR